MSTLLGRLIELEKPRQRRCRSKQLTKPRPYSIDDFVDDRVREMKAMENMMDEMRRDLDRRRGSRRRRPDSRGMGLWVDPTSVATAFLVRWKYPC